jgi:hypothetical protein
MSFAFGGLVIEKEGIALTDAQVLAMLGKQVSRPAAMTVREATSRTHEGVLILQRAHAVIVFDRDLPHGCGFDTRALTSFDHTLAEISASYRVVCFLLNGTSESYAYAIFEHGNMLRAASASGGVKLTDSGTPTRTEQGVALNEQGMIQLLENSIGIAFARLMDDVGRAYSA